MEGTSRDDGLLERLTRQSEEALGRLADDLVANRVLAGAVSRAFQAREKAAQAQEAAMGALGIPSAADVERLTRRLRSISQRLEGIEDALDRLETRLDAAPREGEEEAARGVAIETRLDEIARGLAALRETVAGAAEPPPRAQERLTVAPPGAAATRPRG